MCFSRDQQSTKLMTAWRLHVDKVFTLSLGKKRSCLLMKLLFLMSSLFQILFNSLTEKTTVRNVPILTFKSVWLQDSPASLFLSGINTFDFWLLILFFSEKKFHLRLPSWTEPNRKRMKLRSDSTHELLTHCFSDVVKAGSWHLTVT